MEMNNINEQEINGLRTDGNVGVEIKRPKRVLHFSDGVMDEFDDSDDEADSKQEKKESMDVVESELQWGPWMFHKATKAGITFLSGCDYVGGSLASMLGITTPKYQSEMDEFKRQQARNEKIERENAEHAAAWMEKDNANVEVIVNDIKVAAKEKDKF